MTDRIKNEGNENHNQAIGVVDYSKHTKHMKKAQAFTYNYATIDGVIVECYETTTAKLISEIMNEYPSRIRYRVAFLQRNHPDIAVWKNTKAINKGTYNVSNVGKTKVKKAV